MAETTKGGGQRAASGTRAQRASSGEPEKATPAITSGQRTATLDLPFVTAQFRMPQFRAPQLRVPGRGELDAAAMGAWSLIPSRKSAIYFGALAVTTVVGVIEWPVAAAIGVGTALASRGEPGRGGESPRQR